MAIPKKTLWSLDPHTKAKHDLLRKYLEAWFPILNKYNKKIIYIDGFCGPGRYEGGEPGSPIIAIDVAAHHPMQLKGEIIFWFIDEREDRIEHLKKELSATKIPGHFKISIETGKFHERLKGVLDYLDKELASIAPTFAFVDPFGFSGVSFSLLQRLLKHEKCEVFITFMVDSINRFLNHPDEKIRQHIAEVFGTDEVLKITEKTDDRIQALRTLYQEQLKKISKFVRYFEMRDKNNRPQYYLFFAANHALGHLKMKEAMWRVDPNGEFRFSDATDPCQVVLFEESLGTASIFKNILKQRFSGKRQIICGSILKYVENETAYLKKHMNQALKELELENQIVVEKNKADGKPRRLNTYPDTAIVNFI